MIKKTHSRDLKPSNFASGREDMNELRKIYLLDFGMCRQYLDEKGQIRRPRQSPGFRGTIRYAPLSCHVRRETSRKDDVESYVLNVINFLIYFLVGSINKSKLREERCLGDRPKIEIK